ncbi:MAG: phosphoenolpyruvate--protein phosphotransferase [Clostridia bacterium]
MEIINVNKAASRGIVALPVYKYEVPNLEPDFRSIMENEISNELSKFEQAKEQVLVELRELSGLSEIFAAHAEIADDFTLQEGIISKIKSQNKNALTAVYETIEEIATMFSMVDDPYMQERSADVKDVGKRFMAKLKNVKLPDLSGINSEVIVIAKDLYPSDTVKIDRNFVKGIITEEGGTTSHVFIIAKSMDIPIIVGVKGMLSKIVDNDIVCMDAQKGEIILHADEIIKNKYTNDAKLYYENKEKLKNLRKEKLTDKNGKKILLCANVGSVKDIENALEMNIDGVGLFRSELLYMDNIHFPTEQEQYEVYKKATEICPNELTIRTLDIGGDKSLSYFMFEEEENPFLGWRAVRICLEMKEMFKDQLKAILRASTYGQIRMMIPMIISMQELIRVKKIVEECKIELKQQGLDYDDEIEIGMMIETPASVILAEDFAKEVDFFSIGTNDLTQYILAVDRGNKKVADMYDYFHPAVLKSIKTIIDAGHKENIKVGMCGEMAGDTNATKILLEMGLDEFSMSASSMDYVREAILKEGV